VLERLGRHDEALEHAQLAHDLFTGLGNRAGIAHSRNAIGWSHTRLGAHDEARRWCESALAMMRDLGQHDGEAHTWDSLGRIHLRLGAPAAALDCYRHAVDLWRRLGIRTYEAETTERMAAACNALGDRMGAYRARMSAAAIRDDLAHHRLRKAS
jgi:tetratricopeptide (TPR) repeat protein